MPQQPHKLKLFFSHLLDTPSPVLYSPSSDGWNEDSFSKQRQASTLLKVVPIYYMGTAEWLFLTLLRSTCFLHTFCNTRHMAPIQQAMEGFAVCDFMKHSRNRGSSGSLFSACVTLVGGKSKGCAMSLWINLWIYEKHTKPHKPPSVYMDLHHFWEEESITFR